ncbi:peptide ABC transporter permease [Dictyobacter alpinus]|uniref:Peptide ABC transporter permease n=1 Tax=Dictyobacter alpinus TaxID=2014873 RepID=A0A402BIR8_9CHLR|nr:ABC transporter permease [Dictyobacter alpinus]GCE31226.1 peptide ABC transporter permease [Dictyobacter alpinus]
MDTQDHNLKETTEQEKATTIPETTTAVSEGARDVEIAEQEDEPEIHTTSSKRRVPEWFEIIWSNRKARAGLILLVFFILLAIFANVLAPYSPTDISFGPSELPSSAHWLGTTQAGQDVFSQLIHGTRTSLLVGALGGGLATLIALVIGMVAGYMGGIVDEILSFIINLGLVVPALPLMVTVAAYSPVKGPTIIILVIGLTSWAWGARFKRSQVLTLRVRDYITSAQFAGEGTLRIVFREILPNMLSLTVLSYISAAIGAIGAEAGLEFLGVGDPSTISWGMMLYWANNGGALVTGQWAWLIAPGLALAGITSCLMLINFGVDALSNPQLREE